MTTDHTKSPRPLSQDKSIISTPRRTSQSSNSKMPPRVRGLDEIKPFLKQVGKIITEESQKYDTTDSLSWYKTWESWDKQDILTRTSMNSITNIICPDLFYNQRTIKAVVNRCLEKIPPIESYIDITHLSDKSVEWTSRVGDIASFKSIKMRSRNSK